MADDFGLKIGVEGEREFKIERGIKAPKLETFVRIVNAVGVSPEYLLQDSLKTVDTGNLVRDALNTLTIEQQKLFKEFILGLIKSMG